MWNLRSIKVNIYYLLKFFCVFVVRSIVLYKWIFLVLLGSLYNISFRSIRAILKILMSVTTKSKPIILGQVLLLLKLYIYFVQYHEFSYLVRTFPLPYASYFFSRVNFICLVHHKIIKFCTDFSDNPFI